MFRALVFWFPAFLFSTTVHEAAHAWAARRGGDSTAHERGLVSLSPWPHVGRSPVGMLFVPIVTSILNGWTMGWATTPYDPGWAERHPRRAAWMAAAGPAGNLGLAACAFALLRAGLAWGLFVAPADATLDRLADPALRGVPFEWCAFLATGLSVLLMLNVILLAFNLLPLPPLDGAGVVTLFVPEDAARAVRRWTTLPGLSFVGILAAWQLFPRLTHPLFDLVVRLLYPGQY